MTNDAAGRGAGRPPVADRGSVEQVALALMLHTGFHAVSVADIARAAGISRTTFFRYFGSKSGVIWSAFDDTIAHLDEALNTADGTAGVLDVLRGAIGSSTRTAIYSSEAWLERFRLLDTHDELRSGALEHWDRWQRSVALFVSARIGADPDALLPATIAAAAQATFLADLRTGPRARDDRLDLLERLDRDLRTVLGAFQPLLDDAR